MNKILDKLRKLISNEESNILEFIINYQDEQFSKKEVDYFLNSLSDVERFKEYYTISGSGGSGIIKPNITSLAFLYLASLGIPMVKTGSEKRTSLNGSTDFFSKLGILNVNINNDKYKFSCLNGYSVSRWKKYKELLSINKSFNDYFKRTEFQDYTLKGKVTIQLNKKASDEYLKKKLVRNPENMFVVYCESNTEIDELTDGKLYVNGEYLLNLHNKYDIEKLENIDDITKINYLLLNGEEDTKSFWYQTLKNEVALFLYLNKFYDSYQKCESIFEEIYGKKYVVKMLKYCNRYLKVVMR